MNKTQTEDCCSTEHHHAPAPAKAWRSTVLQGGFVAIALAYLALAPDRAQVHTLSITFVAIVLEAFPFMLLGVLISGLIEVFLPRAWFARILPRRRWLAVFPAALLGLFFPVCECAVVPVVRRLLRKGVPLGAAVAYLLAAPIVNPVVILSTSVAYAFSIPVVLLRIGAGYAIAVAVGLFMNACFRSGEAALLPGLSMEDDSASGSSLSFFGKLSAGLRHAMEEFLDIGRYLIVGAFFAGAAQTLLVRQDFAAAMAIPALSILMMMLFAILLNLCSESDAFVAASFRSSTMPLSAQMAFMVLGPMFDLKLLAMYHGLFRRRAIVALVASILITVFLAMMLVEVFWP